jgi:hypothetical protein
VEARAVQTGTAASPTNGASANSEVIPYTVSPDVAPLWDEAAEKCVAEFMSWLGREARARHLPVTSATVYRWRSIEDPRAQNLVIEVRVNADDDEAMRLRSDAIGYLVELVEGNLSPASDGMTLQFHWR